MILLVIELHVCGIHVVYSLMGEGYSYIWPKLALTTETGYGFQGLLFKQGIPFIYFKS